jgi:hypothetical protein
VFARCGAWIIVAAATTGSPAITWGQPAERHMIIVESGALVRPPGDPAEFVDEACAVYAGTADAPRLTAVGTIMHGRQTVPGRWLTAHLAVDDVIKGLQVTEVQITYFDPDPGLNVDPAMLAEPPTGQRCLVFLDKPDGDSSVLKLLKPETIRILLLGSRPPAAARPMVRQSHVDALRAELRASARSKDARLAAYALSWLAEMDRGALGAFIDASANKDPFIRAAGLAGRLRLGDKSAIEECVALVDSGSCPMEMLGDVSSGIGQLKGEAYVPGLLRAMDAKEPALRREAAYALALMGRTSCLPGLARAIADTDPETQHSGVCGLANIIGPSVAGTAPTIEVYNADKEKYLRAWRAWCRDELPKVLKANEGFLRASQQRNEPAGTQPAQR